MLAQVQTRIRNSIPVKEFFISVPEGESRGVSEGDESRVFLRKDAREHIVVAWPEGEYTVQILVSDGKRAVDIVFDEKDLVDLIQWSLNVYAAMCARYLDKIEERLEKEYKDLMRKEKQLEEPRIVYSDSDVEYELKQYAKTIEVVMRLERERNLLDRLLETISELQKTIEKVRW